MRDVRETFILLLLTKPVTVADMREVRETFGINGTVDRPDHTVSRELRAAQVHGQLTSDDALVRRPVRLESLSSTSSKKSRKKRGTE